MKIIRSLQVALLGAVLFTHALAQTEAEVASLLPKAQRGNSIAQYNLGRAYANGHGIAADPIEAYVWLSLAYEGGFRGKALGKVAGGLDPTQLETARQRLVERRNNLNAKPGSASPAKSGPTDSEANIPVVRTTPSSSPQSAATTTAPSPALAQELATAATDKQQLSSELSKSWAETDELKKQLAETQAAADFLTAETSKLHAERDSLSTKLEDLTKETAALRADRDNARTLGVQAETNLNQINAQKAVLESSLQAAHDSAATDKKWLGDELTKAFQEITALKAQQTAAKNVVAAPVAPAYPDLSNKVRELEATVATVTAETTTAKQEAARLADDRIEREKQLISLQQQSAALANAHATLLKETESLRRTVATQSAAPTYPDLREQVTKQESQLSALKSEASAASQQITALTQANAAAEKSLAQSRNAAPAYPDLSGKVRELETSVTALTSEVATAKQEASRLADDRIEREKQLITLQQQAASLANTNTALQQETETLRHAATTPSAPAYPDVRAQVVTLENQLNGLKLETKETRAQLATIMQAKEAAEKALVQNQTAAPAYPDLSGKVRELEANLAAQTEALEKSRAAVPAPATIATQSAAPAYPDLSGKVQELESLLATRTTESALASKTAEELRQGKADTEQKLAAAEQARTALTQQFDEFKRSALTNQRENLNRQAQVQMLESEKTALRQQSAADQTRLADLSAQLAASRRKADEVYPTAPSYPDQRARVEQLEGELAKTNEQANSMISLLNQSQQEAKATSDQTEQLRATIHELEAKVASARNKNSPAAPAYPDLRNQVATLEADLKAAKTAAPAYPDLREQVSNLEIQLDAARALPKTAVSPKEFTALKQDLSETKEKLATTLQGYAVLEKERDALASRPAPKPVPDLRGRVSELEAQLAAKATVAAPVYPDLRKQVATLEADLKAAQSTAPSAPAYPDLREQVSNLEIQLEAARALPKTAISEKGLAAIKLELADTQEKLATTLRGYSLLEKERDALANKTDNVASSQSEVARLTEAYNALQRANAQTERELVLARGQAQSATSKSPSLAVVSTPITVTPTPVAPRVAPTPMPVLGKPVVAAAPPPVATIRNHTVVAGDTLVKISQRYYGTNTNWQPIYNANRDVIGPNGALKVGTVLRIP